MEDELRAVLEEDLVHPRRVLAVGEHGDAAREVAHVLELAANLEEAVLGVLDEDQALRGAPARSGGRARRRSTRRRR